MDDQLFLSRLAYLADITNKLNTLNRILQGPNSTIFETSDAVPGFQRMIDIWRNNVLAVNFEIFPTLADYVRDTSKRQQDLKTCILNHLAQLNRLFSEYFSSNDVNESKWIRNPFASDLDISSVNLSCTEQEQLVDISCSSSLRDSFKTSSGVDFWAHVCHIFPAIGKKAIKMLLPFPTTYLCEQTFSALASIKTKARNCLEVENSLRLSVSKIFPSYEDISLRQPHQSH